MDDPYVLLAQAAGFQWDDGNDTKNSKKHSVSTTACEEVFFAEPLVVQADVAHSQREVRHAALGQTAAGRPLFLIFMLRATLICVISARPMSRREREVYRRAESQDRDEEDSRA